MNSSKIWTAVLRLFTWNDPRPPAQTLAEYKAAVDAGEQLFYPGEWAAHIVDDDGSAEGYTPHGRTPQGPCDTTLTPRYENPACRCDTYPTNLGPCAWYVDDRYGYHCVYCDHTLMCHCTAIARRTLPR